jgi:hypothetical protein
MLRSALLLIVLAIVFFLSNTFPLSWIHARKWELLAFWGCVTYLNHQLSKFGFANNRAYFVQFFLVSIVLRLIISLLFLAYFFKNHETELLKLIVNFFVLYLLFTGFEIYEMYRKLQRFS